MATFTFDADTDRQCINITANPDNITEGMENFTLVLNSTDDVILLPEETEVQVVDTGSMWSALPTK